MAEKKIKKEQKKDISEETIDIGEDTIIEELDLKDKMIESLTHEKEDLEIKLKSALSDYQNFKRRVETEKENSSNVLNNIVLREFLNVLDNIYLYMKHLEKDKSVSDSILSGIKLIYDQCNEIVVSQGLSLEEVKEGDSVSPLLHEVVGTVTGERDGIITEVVRVGYVKDGNVVRAARVIVEKKEI
jgi:molecular chaperone GrpE